MSEKCAAPRAKRCPVRVFIAVSVCATALGVLAGSPAQSLGPGEVIESSRRIDWSGAGVVGGIPSAGWTQCGAMIAASATAATIQTAIDGCGTNQFVKLGPGTFNLSAGLNMKSNVVLRGSGSHQTSLVFTNDTPCGGSFPVICFMGGSSADWSGSPNTQPGGSQAASWTGGYAQGATQIVLNNIGSSGIQVGRYLYLDQDSDTAPTADLFSCEETAAGCSVEGGKGNPGRVIGGIARHQTQIVKVVACNPSCTNGATFTISPGLYAPNWRAARNPGAWWSAGMLVNSGIEDVSVDQTTSGSSNGIGMFSAANVWVKGTRQIRSCACSRSMIQMQSTAHATIQDNYFFGTSGHSQNYGVEAYLASDLLIVNNIFQHVVSPMMVHSNQGSVYAYNYTINNPYDDGRLPQYHWMTPSIGGHSGGVMYNLFEGNIGSGIAGDYIHGNQTMNTVFRNYLLGSDPGRIDNLSALRVDAWNRYWNVVGNVLGTPGVTTSYATGNPSVYNLGSGYTPVPDDPTVAATMMRWGNYDTVTGAVRWNASEVPSGIGLYANAVPPSHALPASLYYSARPTWWPAAKPWPPIGPDVTGGNIAGVGGFANSIPARDCYLNSMGGPADGSGTVLAFNASACYVSAPANVFYIRSGATGNGSGSDWTNAHASMPSTLNRGATYYIADGTYGSYTFDDVNSGTQAINLKKATPADHGTSMGWLDSYGDGQAVFSAWDVVTDYYAFDGSTRNADWRTGAISQYGIRVAGEGPLRLDNGAGVGGDNLTFSYVDVEGGGRDTGAGDDVVYGLTGNSNITFRNCALHDSDRTVFLMRGNWQNLVVDNCYLARNASSPAVHGEILSSTDSNGVTFSNNVIEDPEGTAVWAFLNDGVATNWKIYGNTVFHSVGYGREGVSALLYCANDASNNNTCNDFSVYNNTIWGLRGLWSGVFVQAGSGHVVQNNVWYDSLRTNNSFTGTLGYNWYYNTIQDGDSSATKTVCTTACDIFLNSDAKDFRLAAATSAGLVLSSPYNSDSYGAIRGGDGVWDRGAYEFGSGSSDTQAPSVPTGLTATAQSSSQIDLVWSASTDNVGVAGYKLFRGGVQIATVTSGTAYSNAGLTPSTLYSYTISAYDAAGNNSAQSSPAAATTLAGGGVGPPVGVFSSLSPMRVLDTRVALGTGGRPKGPLGAGQTLELRLAGVSGVPATGVGAVTLNVTANEAATSGFFTVYPCGQALPTASNLNFVAGVDTANQVTAPLGANGSVCVYSSAAAQVIADLSGYWSVQPPVPASLHFEAVDPARILDSRTGVGMPDAAIRKLGPGEVLPLRLEGAAARAVAVNVNVTATNTSSASYLTVFPCGQTRPVVSNLNFIATVDVANLVTVRVGTDASVCLYSPVALDVIADLAGVFRTWDVAPHTAFTPATPQRVLDTRSPIGVLAKAPLAGGQVLELSVRGGNGVPANATAVLLNVTATRASGSGYLTVYPCGVTRPIASNVNFIGGVDRANAVTARVGATGKVCIYTSRTTDVIADLSGYLTPVA